MIHRGMLCGLKALQRKSHRGGKTVFYVKYIFQKFVSFRGNYQKYGRGREDKEIVDSPNIM
jgi:hypothetical protein